MATTSTPRAAPRAIAPAVPSRRPAAVWALAAVLAVEGLSAIAGGVAFLADTSGAVVGMTPADLAATPIDTYLLPGLWLLLGIGIAPLVVAWALLTRPRLRWLAARGAAGGHRPPSLIERVTGYHPAWAATLIVGIALIAWILVELAYGYSGALLQAVYAGVGLVIIGLAALPSVRAWLRTT